MKNRDVEILYEEHKGLRITKKDKDKEIAGKRAELKVSQKLKADFQNTILLDNLYFEDDFDKRVNMYRTIQIDHILITNYCVYVVETKSFPNGAAVKGSSLNKSLQYDDGKVHTEYNPFKQNKMHIAFLKGLLEKNGMKEIEIESIVCFVGEGLVIETSSKYSEYLTDLDDLSWMIIHHEDKCKEKMIDKEKVATIISSNQFNEQFNIPTSIEEKHKIYVKYVNKYNREHRPKRGKRNGKKR